MAEERDKKIIEALLFVADRPLPLDQIKDLLGIERRQIKLALNQLQQRYLQYNSFRLREVAGGYQLVTDPYYAPWLRKLFQGQKREHLSNAALETLAIIAYKQPITRPEMEQIRGVDVSGVIRKLFEKGLIRITGRKKVAGRPMLYGTGKRFLEYFGLNSLDELPPLNQLIEMEQEDGNKKFEREN